MKVLDFVLKTWYYEQFEQLESLARMSDEEKQKTANLLVNKWFHLTQSFTGMVDAEMQDLHINEQAEVVEIQRVGSKMELNYFKEREMTQVAVIHAAFGDTPHTKTFVDVPEYVS